MKIIVRSNSRFTFSLQEIIAWLNNNYDERLYSNIHIVSENNPWKGMHLETTINGEIVNENTLKNALLNTNCVDIDGDEDGDIDADTNDDGEIQVSEAEAVLGLYVSARSISSLEGINAFVNLQALSCETNLLTTLDVSNLTNLEDLRCTNNNLTALNVSNLVNLNYLKFPNNELSTINLNGLKKLTLQQSSFKIFS